MVAARSATRGLSAEDLQSIRATLAGGRKPKVMFTQTAGQIAGQVGQVVQLTDPDGSDEFIVVRFGRDELPFSPTDLMIPPKAAPARRSAPARATDTMTEPSPRPAGPSPTDPSSAAASADPPRQAGRAGQPVPAPREEATMPRSTSPRSRPPTGAPVSPDAGGPAPDAGTSPPAGPAPTPEARQVPQDAQAAEGAPGPARVPGVEAKPGRRAAKAAKPKPPASLTVTLSYTEGEWTVAAAAGTKALAKPYLIKPAEALKMVGMLDVPGVHEAVEQIVSSERAEAQQHAEQLRAQLAEIEAKLAELSDLG